MFTGNFWNDEDRDRLAAWLNEDANGWSLLTPEPTLEPGEYRVEQDRIRLSPDVHQLIMSAIEGGRLSSADYVYPHELN